VPSRRKPRLHLCHQLLDQSRLFRFQLRQLLQRRLQPCHQISQRHLLKFRLQRRQNPQRRLYQLLQKLSHFYRVPSLPNRHRLVPPNLLLFRRMTDLVAPPEDPKQQLQWARQVLRDFPVNSQAVSAPAIRAWALGILRAHRRQTKGKLVRLHHPPKNPPPPA
jgi:hypothetical protein